MNESTITILRNQLSHLRDDALTFFDETERPHTSTRDAGSLGSRWRGKESVWENLAPAFQEKADQLRADLRRLSVRILEALQGTPLIDDTDIRAFRIHVKTMTAALRLQEFRQQGVYVHHDEGTILGVDQPSQYEVELDSVLEARTLFVDAYRAVTEMMDYWSPQAHAVAQRGNDSNNGVRSYNRNTAFIMMWINPEDPNLSDVKDTVQEVFQRFDIKATRADEIEHSGVITQRIVDEIANSEFLFADLTGERPSVYYEVGYAHALGKRVLLYRKKGTKIHFDLASYNCPEYENLGDLRNKLTKRLESLTNRSSVEGRSAR